MSESESPRKIKAVIMEDDPFSVAIIKHYAYSFKRIELELIHIITLDDSLAYVEHNPVDIIFLDYRLHSRLSGLDIIQHIRAKGILTPIIMITGSGSEEVAVTAIKAGASDYLVKGNISSERLERSIEESLRLASRFDQWYPGKAAGEMLKERAMSQVFSGTCLTDLSGKIVYANALFAQMFNPDGVAGVVLKDLTGLFHARESFAAMLAELKVKRVWMGQLEFKRPDGSCFMAYVLASMAQTKGEDSANLMFSFIPAAGSKEKELKQETLYKGLMEVYAMRAEGSDSFETHGHLRRVAAFTAILAGKLKEKGFFAEYITDKYVDDLVYASILHDVGKWCMPDAILLKPGGLTPQEWEVMRDHPRLGVEMLAPLLRDKDSYEYLKLVECVVMYHHERWDGSGYPQGLKGEDIPLSARIVGLVDAYESITSPKLYRKAYNHDQAVEILKGEKHKFDPHVWKAFEACQQEFKAVKESHDERV